MDAQATARIPRAFEPKMVFAQIKTEGKGQELSAIEKLLELNGAGVTIDALGRQKDIAQQILDAHGHYILQVKDNWT